MPRVLATPTSGLVVQWDNGYYTRFDGAQLEALYLRQFGQDAPVPITDDALAAMRPLP